MSDLTDQIARVRAMVTNHRPLIHNLAGPECSCGESLPCIEQAALAAVLAERDRLDIRIHEISEGFAKANRLHPIAEDSNLCTTCQRPYPCPTVKALCTIDDQASEVITARDGAILRAEQAEECLSIAYQTSNTSERARQAAVQRAEMVEAALRELLAAFVHKGHPGKPCVRTGWISEDTITRWRATLGQPSEGDCAVLDQQDVPYA